MALEQVFPLIASLALLVWLSPTVFRMSPRTRELTSKVALGLIGLGIVLALAAFFMG
ncbi:MAG TPA: hypothetical protein VNS22_10640 [Geminicoccus sp.]|uniref:hypothetical protein n=1 Tax=Geminicoccus sp. TaxID=2024832 RepID=UPI002D12185D|nr:hypothetical protein [Geminicoccus sp.]HWL68828.1 hypothetical protein [Geminicoccus sp.]